ncbi:hypothetical protein K440DRAFT_643526 [Wilcoxina mikolae CBS 423.85]|nr:hypothetical protein K440DRAFT_643526 [Wilcoxina mikolae CBS 423.85]
MTEHSATLHHILSAQDASRIMRGLSPLLTGCTLANFRAGWSVFTSGTSGAGQIGSKVFPGNRNRHSKSRSRSWVRVAWSTAWPAWIYPFHQRAIFIALAQGLHSRTRNYIHSVDGQIGTEIALNTVPQITRGYALGGSTYLAGIDKVLDWIGPQRGLLVYDLETDTWNNETMPMDSIDGGVWAHIEIGGDDLLIAVGGSIPSWNQVHSGWSDLV